MNVGLISLILLVVAIAVGFVRNANVGILSIAFATIVCIVFKSGDINASTVVSGFGTSLFIQMVGVAYLFSIIKSNGTLELAAKKVVSLVPAPAIPVVMFLLGMVLSAAGPGSIPCLAIIPVVSIPVAVSAGVNPIMTVPRSESVLSLCFRLGSLRVAPTVERGVELLRAGERKAALGDAVLGKRLPASGMYGFKRRLDYLALRVPAIE